jgi:hypothetical protein
MIVRVVPSIHRPWRDGGFFSCDFFPQTRFTELSEIVEITRLRDAHGRWRKVRGVADLLGEANICSARAFRCADPLGHEGFLVVGDELGVMMFGVGEAGMGSPILWVDDIRDFAPEAAKVLTRPIVPRDPQPPVVRAELGSALIALDSIHEERRD